MLLFINRHLTWWVTWWVAWCWVTWWVAWWVCWVGLSGGRNNIWGIHCCDSRLKSQKRGKWRNLGDVVNYRTVLAEKEHWSFYWSCWCTMHHLHFVDHVDVEVEEFNPFGQYKILIAYLCAGLTAIAPHSAIVTIDISCCAFWRWWQHHEQTLVSLSFLVLILVYYFCAEIPLSPDKMPASVCLIVRCFRLTSMTRSCRITNKV